MNHIDTTIQGANNNRPPLSMGYFNQVFTSDFIAGHVLKDREMANEVRAFIASMKFQFPNYQELAKGLGQIFDQLTQGDFVTSTKVSNRPEDFFGGPDGAIRAYNMLVALKDDILKLQNPVVDAYPSLKNGRSYEDTKILIFTVLWSLLQVTLSYFQKMGIANKSVVETIEKAGRDVTNLVDFRKK